MRKKNKSSDQFQVPLMHAFRDAFDAKDSKRKIDNRVGGEKVLSGRGSLKRRGASESILKRDLAIDLSSLVNTVDLGSAVDLTDFEFVSNSVLNFGLYDVSHLTSEEMAVSEIATDLVNALIQHEPRLNKETLTVERSDQFDETNQKMRYEISAEMLSKPLDIPLEFVAEVDVASGKIHLSQLTANR
jgi:type VI secretion system protein ImpF